MTDAAKAVDELVQIMAQLRDPQSGCAWDIVQNFSSIAPYTLEEAYEVVDAIERNDLEDLKSELGDLLLQVVFHARMAEEQSAFNLEDVARSICDKMTRRHPHVFGDGARLADADQLHANWERAKATERAARRDAEGSASTPPSALDDVAMALPALLRAHKIQKRASRVGFDWPCVAQVRAKLDEELDELDEACGNAHAEGRLTEQEDAETPTETTTETATNTATTITADIQDAIEDELGDVLFSVANLARHLQVDAEHALRRATAKFESRFRHVETLAASRSLILDELDIDALEALWQESKQALG